MKCLLSKLVAKINKFEKMKAIHLDISNSLKLIRNGQSIRHMMYCVVNLANIVPVELHYITHVFDIDCCFPKWYIVCETENRLQHWG